ncbi:hypothetical protein [Methanosaeta sp. UBA458]|jgi:hypothetical protein|uniref:hypothetical protein n=1 Tax=Methanosaeta sp. UBA458 TaxID=1915561 RepID=UPI002580B797|nr:hypothetical protein [Methanosaeta sp. UBA458]
MTEETDLEMLGVMVPKGDKEIIREIAARNRLTISDVARMLITDGIEHIGERDILKVAKIVNVEFGPNNQNYKINIES